MERSSPNFSIKEVEIIIDVRRHRLNEEGGEAEYSGSEVAKAKAFTAGGFTEEFKEGSGGTSVFAVGQWAENRGDQAKKGDDDGGKTCRAPEPSVEAFKRSKVPRGSDNDGGGKDDEEKRREMSQESMEFRGDFHRFDGEFAKPALQEPVGAQVVAVKLLP